MINCKIDMIIKKGTVKILNKKLYFITDSTDIDNQTFLNKVEQACRGGIDILQLREKSGSDKDMLDLAFKVKEITDRYNIPFIIDDRIDIAKIAGCGVHLGQNDIPVKYARQILGKDAVIGATAKTVEQAENALEQGTNYLGVGAIYPTTTKVITIRTSISTLNDICSLSDVPVFAIGGLNSSNIDILKGSDIAGICVVSAIMKSENPHDATIKLKEKMNAVFA